MEQKYQELILENEKLREEIKNLKANNTIVQVKKAGSIMKRIGGAMLGKKLKNSFLKLYEEIPEKRVSKDTLAELSANLSYRFTRIGIFAFLGFIVPSLFLVLQTWILFTQNRLINLQNEQVKQQTYLSEASRRSATGFELTSILDRIDDELIISPTGRLSDQLIGRITALSRSLTAYYFLDDEGKLVNKALSPERGQLLLSILRANISEAAMKDILENSDFSYARIQDNELAKLDMRNVNLSKASLKNTNFNGSDFSGANLQEADLAFSKLMFSDLSGANVSMANLYDTDLSNAVLKKTKFSNSYLPAWSLFVASNVEGILLENAYVPEKDWLDKLMAALKKNKVNTEALSKYSVDGGGYSNSYDDKDDRNYYRIITK